ETLSGRMRLPYFLREAVAPHADVLSFSTQREHLVARGCAVYQRRRKMKRLTYFDYLPQLQLAVRRGAEPVFIDLIDPNERIEGGGAYEADRDLGLSVQPGTSRLDFYLLREGHPA